MRQDFFTFRPQLKLWVVGNHKPGLRNVDQAMRRRLHVVPFDITIPIEERDPTLSEKLRIEWPIVLRWCIEGCLEWQAQGLNPPDVVRAATNNYLSDEDAIGLWLGLRFKRLARPYRDVSGGRIHQYVTARRFVIGGLQFRADFVALPNTGQSDNGDCDASVGAAALSNFDVEIDGPRKVVTLHHAQQRCSGRLVHWANEWAEIPFGFGEQVPEFDATIDGRRIRAVFDTGASRTVMDLSLARRLFGIAPNSPGVVSLGEQVLPSGKRLPFYAFRFKRLAMGGLAFDDVEVVLGEFDAVPFTLGMSEIKQLHLYVAFRRTVIYATKPAAR